MVESGEARKGAVVRLTFDAGGTPGWRREPGHPAWKRGPSLTDAATAFLDSAAPLGQIGTLRLLHPGIGNEGGKNWDSIGRLSGDTFLLEL